MTLNLDVFRVLLPLIGTGPEMGGSLASRLETMEYDCCSLQSNRSLKDHSNIEFPLTGH